MRYPQILVVCALTVPGLAGAEVVELDGEGLVDAYVQGISIGQVVTDKKFDSDDQEQRDAAAERQGLQGKNGSEIAVSNADALMDQRPRLGELVPETLAAIHDEDVRDLAEDALVHTQIVRQDGLSDRLAVNFDKLGDFNIGTPGAPDASALRGTLMELLPSTTGYQFEFMKDR
ncbi:MAG: hypothetical protein ACOY3X_05020 [Pseudomonadota bacterium]